MRGRSGKPAPTPIKEFCLETGLSALQPEKIDDDEFHNSLKTYGADVFVVVAYGKILPRELLKIPPRGCINVHPSRLPLYRGAAPIQRSIINGDSETAVCTMLLDEGLDTGPTLLCRPAPINADDTYGSLSARLADLGAHLLLETLDALDRLTLRPQIGPSTYARPISAADTLIDWTKPAVELYNLVRGLNPRPAAHVFINAERVKILRAAVVEGAAEAGKIVGYNEKGLLIGTGDGLLSILELQPEGKRPMPVRAFMAGRARGDFKSLRLDRPGQDGCGRHNE
jgi:methionyl-tRNA formyltransferase